MVIVFEPAPRERESQSSSCRMFFSCLPSSSEECGSLAALSESRGHPGQLTANAMSDIIQRNFLHLLYWRPDVNVAVGRLLVVLQRRQPSLGLRNRQAESMVGEAW